MTPLTEQEQNLLKDILKVIANDSSLTNRLSSTCGMSVRLFDEHAESIFNKLQNGRVIIETP